MNRKKIIYGVYTHASPEGIIFHVGKGPRGRSYSKINRNKKHRRMTKKYGWKNIGIRFYVCSSETAALLRERKMIKNYRKRGIVLTNMTSGGQGLSGYRHSIESRRKMSSPIHFKSRSKSSRRNMQNSETREKIRKALIGTKRPPKVVKKARLALKRTWQNKEMRKRQSRISKKLWKDPNFRNRALANLKKLHESTQWRENMSKISKERYNKNKNLKRLASIRFKKLWKSKRFRNRVIKAQNKGRSTKAYKEKRKQIALQLWNNPKFRRKISRGHKRYHANKNRR